MRARWMQVIVVLCLGGCDGVFGLTHLRELPEHDGGIPVLDSAIDGPPAVSCMDWPAPRHFQPCSLPPSSGVLNLTISGTYLLDTTSGMLTNPVAMSTTLPSMDAGFARIFAVDALVIGPGVTLRVVGSKPLLFASWSTITVDGTIDASSKQGGATGAGARDVCTNMAFPGLTNAGGAGGGGGGGLQGAGGDGGRGDAYNQGGDPGKGGFAVAYAFAGGCVGAAGGTASQAPGAGGKGGGAVQLTARTKITVSGTIHAGGAGGAGAIAKITNGAGSGGGGGGSGGVIDLEAPMVVLIGAVLAANGGGGGEGSDETAGARGQDAQPLATPAAGGVGGSVAGEGGDGSSVSMLGGGTGIPDNTDGGGGGGGGAGFVVIATPGFMMQGAPLISPPALRP